MNSRSSSSSSAMLVKAVLKLVVLVFSLLTVEFWLILEFLVVSEGGLLNWKLLVFVDVLLDDRTGGLGLETFHEKLLIGK